MFVERELCTVMSCPTENLSEMVMVEVGRRQNNYFVDLSFILPS